MKTPRICKCGHLREEHIKEPKTWKSFPNECQRCKCSDYMNRKYPNSISKIMMCVGIFEISLMFIAIPLIYFSPEIYNNWDKKTVPVGVLMTTLFGMFIIAGLIFFTSLILPFFSEKRRTKYDVEP